MTLIFFSHAKQIILFIFSEDYYKLIISILLVNFIIVNIFFYNLCTLYRRDISLNTTKIQEQVLGVSCQNIFNTLLACYFLQISFILI